VVNIPSRPEIITVNSEELQTLIRDLLPSQNGFGSELQASNVITPIIDLTATAEGSSLRSDLQTSLAFGSQTSFSVSNQTTTLLTSPGFYRVVAIMSTQEDATSSVTNNFALTDGLAIKELFEQVGGRATGGQSLFVDFNVFLAAGQSLTAQSSSTFTFIRGSTRQIAQGDGTIVPPNGFPL
jgi:hypothetical protein